MYPTKQRDKTPVIDWNIAEYQIHSPKYHTRTLRQIDWYTYDPDVGPGLKLCIHQESTTLFIDLQTRGYCQVSVGCETNCHDHVVDRQLYTDSCTQTAVHKQLYRDSCTQTTVHRPPDRQLYTDSCTQTTVHRQLYTDSCTQTNSHDHVVDRQLYTDHRHASARPSTSTTDVMLVLDRVRQQLYTDQQTDRQLYTYHRYQSSHSLVSGTLLLDWPAAHGASADSCLYVSIMSMYGRFIHRKLIAR